MQHSLNFRLAYLIALSKVETTAMLCLASWLMSIGFILGAHDLSMNYQMIWQLGDKYFWCYTFGLYALVKTVSLFSAIDYRLTLVNSVVGLWGWLYLCLSFTVFDTTQLSPHELAFVVPVVAEAWLLLAYQHRLTKE